MESDGDWPVVAGAGLAGFFDAVAVVAGSCDGAGTGAVASGWVNLVGDLSVDVEDGLSPVLRREWPPSRGGTAGQAQGPDETDPVGIGVEVGGLDGFGDQYRDRVVDQQPGPDLLMDQSRQAGAQDLAGPAQMSLELVIAGSPPNVRDKPQPARRRGRRWDR